MRRTNIYLDERQLQLLRELGRDRGSSVTALVRDAVDSWLEAQGARPVGEDEWDRRFANLMERRRKLAAAGAWDADAVDRDVAQAVREARAARSR